MFLIFSGRIYADIQWTGLFSNPLVVEVEDVFILVTPLIDQPYNEEKQKAFNLARKRLLLESVDTKRKRSDPAGNILVIEHRELIKNYDRR